MAPCPHSSCFYVYSSQLTGVLNFRRFARRNTKSLSPTNGYFSLIASRILDQMSTSSSVLTKLTNSHSKILLWLIDKFSLSSSASPSYIRANSNGLDCSGGVFCYFPLLLLGTDGDADWSRSCWLKQEHNPVLRLLCNMDRAHLTALETLLLELKLFSETTWVTESGTFVFELELVLANTLDTSLEHSPNESARLRRCSSILLVKNGGRGFWKRIPGCSIPVV